MRLQAVASAFGFAIVDARSTCYPPLCEVSSEILVEAFAAILAEATTTGIFAQCAGPGDTFDITVLSEQIVTATATSLTAVLGQASVIGGVCDFSLEAIAAATANAPITENINKITFNPIPEPVATKPAPKPSTGSKPVPKPVTPIVPKITTTPVPVKSVVVPKCGGKCAKKNRQCDGLTFKAPVACCDDKYLCVRRNSRFSQCRRAGKPGSKRWDGTIVKCGA